MIIMEADFHPEFQQIASVDTEAIVETPGDNPVL
jgi:hypothetical protein